MRYSSQRMPLIDALKGIACLVIVGHHLTAYGPMSDAALPLLPNLLSWMFDFGRMAVQVFLVVSGYLMASQLSQLALKERQSSWIQLIQKRYLRLVVPYGLALAFGIFLSAVAHWLFGVASFEAVSNGPQLLAHVLLIQNWVHQPSIAAGVWYVAIDFQLFALVTAIFCVCQWHVARTRDSWMKPETDPESLIALVLAWVLVLSMAALFYFNRHSIFDVSAIYFMGSYGLGMLARWFSTRPKSLVWVLSLMALVCFALWFDFRWRVMVAGFTAMLLCMPSLKSVLACKLITRLRLTDLGKISYAVFLVHFPICMAFNEIWPLFFAGQSAWGNVLGLILALISSVTMGYVFWRWVEMRVPNWLSAWSQWFKVAPVQR
jgi:peptidoglycan/LPS O-acetylase OafA/YrhL